MPLNEGEEFAECTGQNNFSNGFSIIERWIMFPLRELKQVEERHSVVEYFLKMPN